MKRISAVLIAITLLTSCGGVDGKKLADENCDCQMKANAMDANDPKRKEAQDACLKKSADIWAKVKDNAKEAEAYNKAIGECADKIIKQAFGK